MFERNIDTFTISEQLNLHKSKVVIAGIGGGGCSVAEILARVGVGKIVLIDGDKFEDSNKNRQLGATDETLGKYKPEVMAGRIASINKNCTVEFENSYLNKQNYEKLFKGADVICDCTDGRNNKIMVNECSILAKLPYVSGGLGNFTLWTAHFQNKKISDVLHSSNRSLSPNCVGIFIQAALQANEVIKVLLNRDSTIADKIIKFNQQTYTMCVEDI